MSRSSFRSFRGSIFFEVPVIEGNAVQSVLTSPAADIACAHKSCLSQQLIHGLEVERIEHFFTRVFLIYDSTLELSSSPRLRRREENLDALVSH